MFDWLWKWLGHHVCEDFTPWKVRSVEVERLATPEEVAWNRVRTVSYHQHWQERRCLECGKVQQQRLQYAMPEVEGDEDEVLTRSETGIFRPERKSS